MATLLIKVEESISKMKHGKASVNNSISADLLKVGNITLATWIYEIIVEI